SLWNRLFQMQSKRSGYGPECLKKEKEGFYTVQSKTRNPLFSIEALSVKAKRRIERIVLNRKVETEETSIKFFNLPADEISHYRAGNPSHALSFELSFWSDLAKWIMALTDEGQGYEILFGEGV